MPYCKEILSEQQREAVKRLIDSSQSIAIVCHMTPDGDALGSSLFLQHILRAAGHKATVIVPDQPPQFLMFLPGADEIVVASRYTERARVALQTSDLTICLDFNDLKRIDRLAPMVEDGSPRRLVVDHHMNPSIEADIVISHPEKSSTSLLVYQIAEEIGLSDLISRDAATCCLTGMLTDTGGLAYNSLDPDLYLAVARMVELGVDKDQLYIRLFNVHSETSIRISGYAQSMKMDLVAGGRGALITLSGSELKDFGYQKGDTEGLVNIPLAIPGVQFSIYLREDEPEFVKVSMRSRGEFSVKELCERYFGGGGHLNAAGGEVHGSLSQAIQRVIDIIPEAERMLAEIES